MPKRRPKGDIKLRFSGSKEPLRFSDLRERYLQAHAWKGLSTQMQKERLMAMERKFLWLKGLFDKLEAGEQIKVVAKDAGVSPECLEKWWRGKSLPRPISQRAIEQSVGKRLNHLREASLKNPKIGYILGAMLSGHLLVRADKRGQVEILSSIKAGSVEHALKDAQDKVFGYRLASRTRELTRAGSAASVAAESRAHSVGVATFLNEATFFGSHIPLKFLKTKPARRQFAMALIDANAFPFERSRAGRARQVAGIRFKTRNRELRDYFSKLLSEFGVQHNPRGAPLLSKEEKWHEFKKGTVYQKKKLRRVFKKATLSQKKKVYEIFIPRTSFEKFRKEIGFRDPSKAKMLDKLISQS